MEEVGVSSRVLGLADTITYFANNTPKVVVFWHMLATGTSTTNLDTNEVGTIDWFGPNDAVRILDYGE